MLFVSNQISTEEMESINNFFDEYENHIETSTEIQESPVSKYITSLANGCYAKSVYEIANTKIGNRVVRKRNLQQIMKESFFYGANRFGNNFIA